MQSIKYKHVIFGFNISNIANIPLSYCFYLKKKFYQHYRAQNRLAESQIHFVILFEEKIR